MIDKCLLFSIVNCSSANSQSFQFSPIHFTHNKNRFIGLYHYFWLVRLSGLITKVSALCLCPPPLPWHLHGNFLDVLNDGMSSTVLRRSIHTRKDVLLSFRCHVELTLLWIGKQRPAVAQTHTLVSVKECTLCVWRCGCAIGLSLVQTHAVYSWLNWAWLWTDVSSRLSSTWTGCWDHHQPSALKHPKLSEVSHYFCASCERVALLRVL